MATLGLFALQPIRSEQNDSRSLTPPVPLPTTKTNHKNVKSGSLCYSKIVTHERPQFSVVRPRVKSTTFFQLPIWTKDAVDQKTKSRS